MTKADLARIIHEKHGAITNRDALRIVDVVFDLIKKRLKDGDTITITRFGTLKVVVRKSRRGRNPVTGEVIEVTGRKALVFRPSRSIRSV